MAKSISWFQPDWACISLAEDKTKDRKTQKQTTTEASCSKGLAKHHKGVNSVSGDAHESLHAKDSIYDSIYLYINIWAHENESTVYKNGCNS